MKNVIEEMEKRANIVEKERMKVIGMSTLLEKEINNRESKKRELQNEIEILQRELSKLSFEYESLSKLEQEQQEVLDGLNGNK
ncbi:hypothetical protein O9G_005462 [Rozella allomycis CSF55]|uniref:Uncharacterized protein n=1 Tax=Rozella allomycis (strain CSF55) TaxID=988480 RepID=A0A075AQ51_ROZAC|nr:hypothetical protein O9G_005462 [Rozella allomycis CSF55]|eukprot:EPZ30860.1 hypothetical protein O9G_005462 [Rozella allomycis CSF55]